jgi:hypothetical protein
VPEPPAADEAGPEAAGPEAAGPEAAGPEAAGPEAAGPDEAGPEAAGPEAAGPDGAGRAEDADPPEATDETPFAPVVVARCPDRVDSAPAAADASSTRSSPSRGRSCGATMPSPAGPSA